MCQLLDAMPLSQLLEHGLTLLRADAVTFRPRAPSCSAIVGLQAERRAESAFTVAAHGSVLNYNTRCALCRALATWVDRRRA